MSEVTLDSMIADLEATMRQLAAYENAYLTPEYVAARIACLTAARDRIAELELANKTLTETVNARRVAMAHNIAGDSIDGKTISFRVEYQIGHSDAELRRQVEAATAAERERAARVCETVASEYRGPYAHSAQECAAAIRARGKVESKP